MTAQPKKPNPIPSTMFFNTAPALFFFKPRSGASTLLSERMIHTPTGAEFTPVTGTLDSILIWTGDIGGIMPTGERYRYADVFAVMKKIWQQGFQPGCRFESRGKRHLQRSKGAKLSA